MRYTLTIILSILLSVSLYAQDNRETAPGNGGENNSLLVFGGYHSYLYGYRDRRYVDTSDQGDYIKTYGQYYGIEYSHLGFGEKYREVKDVRTGGFGTFYFRDSLASRTLYAVTSPSIPEEVILANPNDRAMKASLKLGIFGGLDDEWYEVSLGVHANLQAEYESRRLRYAPNGDIISSSGRGWMWRDSSMRVNFLGRLGLKNNAHFKLAVFREDYDPNYGKVMAKIFIPISSYFNMQAGAFLYPSDAAFIQPDFTYSGITLSPRIGLIINYRDDNIEKVGLFEGFFMTCSASYIW